MTFKVVSVPQVFYEDKKTLKAGEAIEKKINEMAEAGYEFVNVVITSSEVHTGCCCWKQVHYRYENQLVFVKR